MEQSAVAPTPTFGVGTINTAFEQFDRLFLDFNLTPDVGAPTVAIAIPNFGVADTGTIYSCDGCNMPDGPGIPLAPGQVNLYFPANEPSGSPDMYTIANAFPPALGYFIYGTLQFTDPAPMNTPEPSASLLMVAGTAFMWAYAGKTAKNSRQAESIG